MDLVSTAKVVRRRPRYEAARRFVRTRKGVQTLSVALLIGMPLLGIFRVDIAGGYLVLGGQQLSMGWLALVLPLVLLGVPGIFFLLSMRFGRLFCSWACPQGALNEAATKSQLAIWGRRRPWVTKRDRRYPRATRRRSVWWQTRGRAWWLAVVRYVTRGLFFPPLAAFALVSYGVAPARLGSMMLSGSITEPAVLLFFAVCGMLYADLLVLQETTCRVCFFGYLQSVASYSQRTGVQRNAELKGNCHGCSGCRDACFAGVDPRYRAIDLNRSTDLVFDNCVSCGDCLVACDDLTSRRGLPLIMELAPAVTSRGSGFVPREARTDRS